MKQHASRTEASHQWVSADSLSSVRRGDATSRRALLGAALGVAGVSAAGAAAPHTDALPVPGRLPLVLFSKHLHWAGYALAASITRDTGCEGVDLTVRRNGHVEPSRVREDLPRAVEAFSKAGVPVVMITTDIQTPESPHTSEILETARSLGILRYRWRDFAYKPDTPIPPQLEALKPGISALAKLNESIGMTAMYHIHSGFHRMGTSVWDLWSLLRDEDPNRVSFNFDIGHATVEGGFGGWINSLHLVLPHTRGTAAKDFYWAKNPKGEWRPRWCPIGEGMVDWPRFFTMLGQSTIPMPLQLHLEYQEMGGAGTGKKVLDLPREKVVTMIRQDAEALKRLRSAAGLG